MKWKETKSTFCDLDNREPSGNIKYVPQACSVLEGSSYIFSFSGYHSEKLILHLSDVYASY